MNLRDSSSTLSGVALPAMLLPGIGASAAAERSMNEPTEPAVTTSAAAGGVGVKVEISDWLATSAKLSTKAVNVSAATTDPPRFQPVNPDPDPRQANKRAQAIPPPARDAVGGSAC